MAIWATGVGRMFADVIEIHRTFVDFPGVLPASYSLLVHVGRKHSTGDRRVSVGVLMRNVLGLAGAALLLFAGPAAAADLAVMAPVYKAPPPPVYSWTGCYVGATAGGASGKSDVSWASDPIGFLGTAGTLAAQTSRA
jgi:hypothetical protein